MTVRRSQPAAGNQILKRRALTLRRTEPTLSSPRLQFKWASTISELEWAVYCRAMDALRSAGIRFLLGGGFALAAFIGRWRDTKDIDFYTGLNGPYRSLSAANMCRLSRRKSLCGANSTFCSAITATGRIFLTCSMCMEPALIGTI